MPHQYFRNGRPVSADEALDPITKTLRDGYTATVATRFRDSAQPRLRITDAHGQTDTASGCRPGFRLAQGDVYLNDARIAAYHDYLEDLTTSWMGDKKKRKYDPQGREAGTEAYANPAAPLIDGALSVDHDFRT